MKEQTVAQLLVDCLRAEGVHYVFGIPGEENIHLVRAIADSGDIRFILARHEQGAAFMADIYGRLTGQAGVCSATLGPGAINLLQGVADAQTNSSPLLALSAQVGLKRIYKESHQIVDLVGMFRPVTKWADTVLTPQSLPEMVRKAFQTAQEERPGAAYLALPEDVEAAPVPAGARPLPTAANAKAIPSPAAVTEAARLLRAARKPVILAGHGVARTGNAPVLAAFAERYQVPVATTFMGKGVISDRSPQSLGVIGFMRHDYENCAFDQADVILSVGYELQEFAPERINPRGDKTIIHINTFLPDTDAHYATAVNITADAGLALAALSKALGEGALLSAGRGATIRQLVEAELAKGRASDAFPLKPQRLVADIRAVMGDEDIVLADTGAIKMWMARLYPTYAPLTCLVSNGLSTMGFSLPGAIGAHLARPERKVLAVMGDGSFLMNSQEMETAVRENIPLKILIWVDNSYGLIKWKMDMASGSHACVDFGNPDFTAYAASFGAKGYRVESAAALRPTLQQALDEPGVSLVACPVDYSENMALIDTLGELTPALCLMDSL
ncbi:acetolactate synthase large subunit [Desulfovibrio legallii]|jgi:acetolactate synthase-1/2/3 large subunit|uniref:Acetolactate synthase-1/2/3 large subunit n=1 Tax=Desulfovibrio legallii TaxID=571438 RepID=A0A1G7N129_9BACT|nr:acetolactate synthase large subunit [Desulfovibrio legallii]SDF67785.1 acetolactate synthase-1/2/3 large subunit [Desulfovibrio legallii]